MEILILYATIAGIILLPPAFLWFWRKEFIQKYIVQLFELVIFPLMVCFGIWLVLSFFCVVLELDGMNMINLAISIIFTVHICNELNREVELTS